MVDPMQSGWHEVDSSSLWNASSASSTLSWFPVLQRWWGKLASPIYSRITQYFFTMQDKMKGADLFLRENVVYTEEESYQEFRQRLLAEQDYPHQAQKSRSFNNYGCSAYQAVWLRCGARSAEPVEKEAALSRLKALNIAVQAEDELKPEEQKIDQAEAPALQDEERANLPALRRLKRRAINAQAGMATYEIIVDIYVSRFFDKVGQPRERYDEQAVRMIALSIAVKIAQERRVGVKDFKLPFGQAALKERSFLKEIDWHLSVEPVTWPAACNTQLPEHSNQTTALNASER